MQTLLWNLANPVKNYHGINELQHQVDLRRMVLLRVVRRVNEGTSAVLLQSGLDEKWWADSNEWKSYLRNVQDLLADGKTPSLKAIRRTIQSSRGPFRALVDFYSISARDQSRIYHFGKNFLSIAGRIWKGDILVADSEEFENMEASEIHPRRINGKEILTPQR